MAPKCRRCIDYYIMERRRLETIGDIHNKNEGFDHAALKSEMCELMREIGSNWGNKSVDTEVYVKGIGKVDVVAAIGDVTIAIECGSTKAEKIRALRERFDIVLHVPYCYTKALYGLKRDELDHQIMVISVMKGLRKDGIDVEKGKPICLEDGECSLPSGRDGYPHEAIQLALGYSKKKKVN